MAEMYGGSPNLFEAELKVSEKLMDFINVSGGGRQLHKVLYDPKSGQFGFVFDDERYKLLFQATQDPAVLEEVKKLKIRLDEAKDKVKSCERENGATIIQAEVWKQEFGDAIAQAEVAKKGEMTYSSPYLE